MTNSIMIDLDDPRTGKIADVISNKTAKKILALLSEGELSESEIAKKLEAPLNTVGYNIVKLEEAGLIEKVKGFLWSVKGKRIHRYKLSNTKIVISPRKIMKGIIPTVLISLGIALGIKIWADNRLITGMREGSQAFEKSLAVVADSSSSGINSEINNGVIAVAQNVWLWFLAGALCGLLIFLLWNVWRKE